jgi:ribonuclease HI
MRSQAGLLSIYCDGASSGCSDAPGGYGYLLVHDGSMVASGYGGAHKTTNNIMECKAAICGLLAAREVQEHYYVVELVSDSQYVLNLSSGKYQPKVNMELIQELRTCASMIYRLSYRWVKGHSGDKFNEIADDLAKKGKSLHKTSNIIKIGQADT